MKIMPMPTAVISSKTSKAITNATPRSAPPVFFLWTTTMVFSYWQDVAWPVVAIEQLLMETSPSKFVSMAWLVLRSMTLLLRIVRLILMVLIDARVTGSLLISMGSDVFGI